MINPIKPKNDFGSQDLQHARFLVRDYPITVELYPSGEIGLVARPQKNGRRTNKSFCTSNYRNLSAAAHEAISFCEGIKKIEWWKHDHIPEQYREKFALILKKAAQNDIDPVAAFRDGVNLHLNKQMGHVE